ncbi:hypothetical protein LEMLEM_LOCUS4885, partial [Lemmus lemmus]
ILFFYFVGRVSHKLNGKDFLSLFFFFSFFLSFFLFFFQDLFTSPKLVLLKLSGHMREELQREQLEEIFCLEPTETERGTVVHSCTAMEVLGTKPGPLKEQSH